MPYCSRDWAGIIMLSGAVLRWAAAGGRAMQFTMFRRSAVAILIPIPPVLGMAVPLLGMAVPLLCMAVAVRADEVYRPAVPILKVAHQGEPVPWLPGVVFEGFAPPQIDAAGNVLLRALMSGPGIDDSNNVAIWFG